MTRILMRRLLLVVTLLGLATLRAAGAEGPGPPPASAARVRQGLPTMLSTATLGKVITEGVGYGGLRLGDGGTEVAARWGRTDCTPQGTRWSCVYALAEDPNTTGELVGVLLEADRIVLFAVLVAKHIVVFPPETPVERVLDDLGASQR